MFVLGIDPGPEMSAYCVVDLEGKPIIADKVVNATMREIVIRPPAPVDHLAIESMVTFSNRGHVGQPAFQTCIWIGRFTECWLQFRSLSPPMMLRTTDVRLHMTGDRQGKEGNVRAALIDRFGGGNDRKAKGTKLDPGPLYGFAGPDMYMALAIALTAQHHFNEAVFNERVTR